MIEDKLITYKLLSACFQIPDENLPWYLDELQESVRVAYPDIFENIPTEMTVLEDFEELKVEYARLFIGPFKLLVPPYGSMYLEDVEHLMANSTLDVLRRYKEENIDVAIQEIPDHISIELEFMYYLMYLEMRALEPEQFKYQKNGYNSNSEHNGVVKSEKSSEKMVSDFRFKQYDFLNKHLSRWIPLFGEKVKEHAKLHTYRYLAFIAEQVVINDLKDLKHFLLLSDK
ncbi:MAG: molecular chaperone [Balneolaceae bacterium]